MSVRMARLCEVCELINGRTFHSSEWSDVGLPIVRIQNLTDASAPFNYFAGVAEDRYRIDSGELLFSWSGTPGTSFGAFFWNRGPAWLNQHIFRVVPRPGVDRRYLRRALNASLHTIISQAHGGVGLQHITKSKLEAVEIPLPPLPEQRRIADILDIADSIRRKRKEAIALTEELLRSAFLEMFGDPVTNPKGWPVKALGELLEFITSGSRGWAQYYATEGEVFIRIQNVLRDCLDLSDVAFVSAPNSAEARRTETRPGDVLLSITADLGRTAVVPTQLKRAYINQHLAILRPRAVQSEYLSAFLASSGGQLQINKRNKGGVKAGLNFDDVRSVQVLVPPESSQRAWAEVKMRIRAKIARLVHMGCIDEELFNSLVSRAFSGSMEFA